MTAFTIVWLGQVVSLVGTAMSGFALTLWAYRTTGLATALAMVAFFNFAPMIVMSPIAGVLVDGCSTCRWCSLCQTFCPACVSRSFLRSSSLARVTVPQRLDRRSPLQL